MGALHSSPSVTPPASASPYRIWLITLKSQHFRGKPAVPVFLRLIQEPLGEEEFSEEAAPFAKEGILHPK